jgi:acyl carrier protein
MDDPKLEAILRAIVIKNAGIPIETVSDDQVLTEDLGFDSLAFVLSLADLEEKLGVAFPPQRVDQLGSMTFREIVDLVRGEMDRTAGEGPSS